MLRHINSEFLDSFVRALLSPDPKIYAIIWATLNPFRFPFDLLNLLSLDQTCICSSPSKRFRVITSVDRILAFLDRRRAAESSWGATSEDLNVLRKVRPSTLVFQPLFHRHSIHPHALQYFSTISASRTALHIRL